MEWAKANPERKRALDKAYNARNRGKIAPVERAWRQRNRSSIARREAEGVRKVANWYARQSARKTGGSPDAARRRILIRRAGHALVFLTAARHIGNRM